MSDHMGVNLSPSPWAVMLGTLRYEFAMQIRRRGVWIVMGLFILWGLLTYRFVFFQESVANLPLPQVIAGWSVILQATSPIAVGLLLADRLPRDRHIGVWELLETFPASSGARLLGKFFGSTFATLVPLVLVYVIMIVFVAVQRGNFMAIPLGIAAFVTINLPGLLFVAAFSIACPAVLWIPLYQVLFVGYWFWGTLINPHASIPSLAGTWLTPLGEYMANGFFGAHVLYANGATVWEGVISMSLLLVLAAVALLSAHLYMHRQQT